MPSMDQQLLQKLGLKISPAQMQLAKLIELPNIQLEQRIKEELEANPALEINSDDENGAVDYQEQEQPALDDDRSLDIDDTPTDDDTDYPIYVRSGYYDSGDNREPIFQQETSFRETLIEQLSVTSLSEEERKIAEFIIGNLDSDGYLRRDFMQLSDDLAFRFNIYADIDTVERIVREIQSFEPAGIAAADLQECLLIQIRRKEGATPAIKLAEALLEESFEEFSKRNFPKVIKKLQCSEEELRLAVEEIQKLNPKPGGASEAGDEAQKITPDFIVENMDGHLHLSLNSGEMPDLRLSKHYTDMLEEYMRSGDTARNREALAFVRKNLGDAKSFIDVVRQRNATLIAVMQAILALQKEFFLSNGDESCLKPMILKDIADITGLDISTISRVSNAKHVETWFGIFPLNAFFSGGIENASGEEVSVEEVKKVLRAIIDSEDKSVPYSDEALLGLMQERGYKLARRTVAKYRDSMEIPVARLRREI